MTRSLLIALLVMSAAVRAGADRDLTPMPRIFASPSGAEGFKIIPHDRNGVTESATGVLFVLDGRDGRERTVWKRTLAGIPDRAWVGGNGVVTICSRVGHPKFGKSHALVIYGWDGIIRGDYELGDLLTTSEIRDHVFVLATVSHLPWAYNSRAALSADETTLTLTLSWGKTIAVSLATGRILDLAAQVMHTPVHNPVHNSGGVCAGGLFRTSGANSARPASTVLHRPAADRIAAC